ncbi:uncharacterized protein GIQ15_04318 [Arthroderma uncinatum]|uniref:uncharacterized protein n=1 Tax=Arthroderma uncinatum TaxID=74035 RepID=UPI00144A9E83|nr:uncharacterized protein GIQ15_04318 [Arthroderma uncinatum]KAF3481559.1 hypothetical protein GIQ15_04318 [Arthroderma uncinatum]
MQDLNQERVAKPWTERKSLTQKRYRRKGTMIDMLEDYHRACRADVHLVIQEGGKTYIAQFINGNLVESPFLDVELKKCYPPPVWITSENYKPRRRRPRQKRQPGKQADNKGSIG